MNPKIYPLKKKVKTDKLLARLVKVKNKMREEGKYYQI